MSGWNIWRFDDIGAYSGFTHTLSDLLYTGIYYDGIVGTINPTINFIYNQVLTNPIIIGLILTLLVLSLFTFGKD